MLTLKNICKSFYEKKLFTNLNLTVSKNDFITIIGSNGAGKSTLLNLISGKLQVDSGEIRLNDDDITYLKPYKKAKRLSRVFQNPLIGTSPSLTIIENLSIVSTKLQGYGLRFAVNKSKIDDFKSLLKKLKLGLENELNTKVGLLSGGQKQALSLLMATLAEPELLLLDEHTAALDPETSVTILKITDQLIKEKNIPVLMVTHNLQDAIQYGNRLLMLDKGKIVLDIKEKEKKNLKTEDLLLLFSQKSISLIS